MLPGFPRVHHRIVQLRLRLHQKIRDVFLLSFKLEVFEEDAIIDISIVVLVSQHFIVEALLQVLPLHPLIEEEGDVVEAPQDGIVDWLQSTATDFVGTGVEDKQEAHHFQLVLLGCSDEWCFSIGSTAIHLSVELLEQQLRKGEIAIDSSAVQWRTLGISGEVIAIDEIRSLFQYFFDIGEVVSFDVVEEVLAVGVAVGDTLQRSHLTEAIKQLYNNESEHRAAITAGLSVHQPSS